MRSQYFIILLLLSTIVLAQSTDINVHIIDPETNTLDFRFDDDFTFLHDFGNAKPISGLLLDIKYIPCNEDGTEYACGTRTACITPMTCTDYSECTPQGECSGDAGCAPSGTPVCKTPENVERQNLSLPVTIGTRVFEIKITGDRDAIDGEDVVLKGISRDIGPSKILTRNLLSLRGTTPIFLGKIKEIVPGPFGAIATVTSSNKKAAAWFEDESGLRATGRTTSPNNEDKVLACLNLDENYDGYGDPVCDFEDERECAEQGKDWLTGNCCGDAPYVPTSGCQWYPEKSALCGQDNTGKYKWAAIGDIGLVTVLNSPCPTIQLVSDGTKLRTCNQALPTIIPAGTVEKINTMLTIQGHDYVCQGENIIECGGDAPYSPNAKTTGQPIAITGQEWYCTSTGKWNVSLDSDASGCQKAGFKYTGTKCCGEPDDPVKTYQDPYTGIGTAGACFNNQFIESGTFFGSDKSTINYRGVFYLCNPTLPENNETNITLPALQGTGINSKQKGPCGLPLPAAILTGTKPHIICTQTAEWKFISSTQDTDPKTIKWTAQEGEQAQGCCPANQCWDGKDCREIGEYYIIGEKGYACQ